ncbi:hypothetical protein BGX26_006901 [Mortierella sp. AD094]|nr:hypothetical protein BGX26_006901 [Mortierella sp. AD094]
MHTTTSTWQSNSSPLAIPEILSIILSFLDKQSILSSITVSRVWNESATPALWKSLSRPPLTPNFFSQLEKSGCHVQHLDVVLDTDNDSYSIVPIEFTRVLKSTPRLNSLSLRLSSGGTSETRSSLLKATASIISNQLEFLSLGIGNISSDDAQEFFLSLTSIKKLELIQCATRSVIKAITEAQESRPTGLHSFLVKGNLSGIAPEMRQEEWFGNDSFSQLSSTFVDLRQISITSIHSLTSAGLISFSERFKELTHINFQCCGLIEPVGFETLIEASPSLTHVRLGHTLVNDHALFKLSSPSSRASKLKVLVVSYCANVTSLGIESIVMFCQNLRILDFSVCPGVKNDIFDGPAWECSLLEVLLMSGTYRDEVINEDAVLANMRDRERRRTLTNAELSNIYRQLGQLKQLRELDIGGMPFDLNLFQLGHTDLEALKKLRVLHLLNMTKPLTRKEITWLATRFESLNVLELDRKRADPELLRELMDINPNICIHQVGDDGESDAEGDRPNHANGGGNHIESDSEHNVELMDISESESGLDSDQVMDEDSESDDYHMGSYPSYSMSTDSEDEDEEEEEEERRRIQEEEEEEEEEERRRMLQEEEEEEEEERRRMLQEEEEEEEEERRRMLQEEEEEGEELRRLRLQEEEEEEEELRRLRLEEEEEEEEELRRLRQEEEEEEEELRRLHQEEEEELRRLLQEEEEEEEEELRKLRLEEEEDSEEEEENSEVDGRDESVYDESASSSFGGLHLSDTDSGGDVFSDDETHTYYESDVSSEEFMSSEDDNIVKTNGADSEISDSDD